MSLLGNDILDSGLGVFAASATELRILSANASTHAELESLAVGLASGNSSPTFGAPADAGGGGRQVTIGAITSGSVTATDTARWYGIGNSTASSFLASGSLSASQAVTNGNTFTLTSFTVTIPDPA